MKKMIATWTLAVLLLCSTAKAEKFANQFVEFELPPQWSCSLEGAEWVCQSGDAFKKRDAIIVLAAKIKGDMDTLDQYLAYLKAAKVYTSVQGKPVKSQVKFARTQNIGGQAWADALHMESEIPSFYTRYLATVKQDIGVLVTYSVNKDKWAQYSKDFDGMVQTLKVFRKSGGGLNAAPASANLFDQAQIPSSVTGPSVFPAANPQGGSNYAGAQKKSGGDSSMLMIVVLVAIVGFIIWRRKRGG